MKYIPALDGYRFFAALIVYLGHFSNETGVWGQILGKGAEEIGVVLFFCLSGFLMGALYLPHVASGSNLRGFALRRLGRVLPLFYFMTMFGFVLTFCNVTDVFFVIDAQGLLRAFFLTDGAHLMWTIVAECHFYLIFALIWIIYSNSPRLAIGILLAGMALSYYLQLKGLQLQRENAFLYLHIFGAGVALSFLMQNSCIFRRLDWPERFPRLANVAFGVVGLLILASYPQISAKLNLPVLGAYQSLILIALCCVFLWLAMVTSAGHAILGNSMARFGGRISYSIYLWHFPILWTLLPLLSGLPREIQLLITTTCLIAISWVSFRVIEKSGQRWFNALGQNIGRHWRQRVYRI